MVVSDLFSSRRLSKEPALTYFILISSCNGVSIREKKFWSNQAWVENMFTSILVMRLLPAAPDVDITIFRIDIQRKVPLRKLKPTKVRHLLLPCQDCGKCSKRLIRASLKFVNEKVNGIRNPLKVRERALSGLCPNKLLTSKLIFRQQVCTKCCRPIPRRRELWPLQVSMRFSSQNL